MTNEVFVKEMKTLVKTHGGVNNPFLKKFSEGNLSNFELERFAIEFFHLVREFPILLGTLLAHTSDEKVATEITNILISEFGNSNPNHRHELQYRKFLISLMIDPIKLRSHEPLSTTKAYLEGVNDLFKNKDPFVSLGAHFVLESISLPIWNQITPGLKILKEKCFSQTDITFFTFHRDLEIVHEEAMNNILSMPIDFDIQESICIGAKTYLDLLEQFWLGLDDKNNKK